MKKFHPRSLIALLSLLVLLPLQSTRADNGSDRTNHVEGLRLAVQDLISTFGSRYPGGQAFLGKVDALRAQAAALDQKPSPEWDAAFTALQKEALLANPLLAFEKLLVVRRATGKEMGLPQNWEGNCSVGRRGYTNEIAVLSPVRPDGKLTTLFAPPNKEYVGDVDLHFDGTRLLFSMPANAKGDPIWHVWEIRTDGTGLRQVTPDEKDIDQYDACYLPDGRILFDSTAGFQGVPCVGGGSFVANLHLLSADGKTVRTLCYDQEHNWYPTLMNDGRIMYSRWEYTDAPHYFTRLLFAMNPDGTAQGSLMGSNSYWPNSIFYARPIPGSATRVIAVISGHHGVPRMGELVLFDVGKGRYEAAGAVQRIPGRGKEVLPVIRDGLVEGSWPRFLHPYPLGDRDTGAGKYFLVSCLPRPDADWGIYLVDVFDNVVPVHELPGSALFEPVPLLPKTPPPVITDRVQPGATNALVYMANIYAGKGLAGVPPGTVKSLRVLEYHFAYRRMGGHINIGVDGPWDVHRILGTVPVNEDGSAFFTVPANTPLAVQPLDSQGRSIQVMRSWFSAQPGEKLSCVGCHENNSEAAGPHSTIASTQPPAPIKPWYGPRRGFSFPREVQPVLDRYCVGCHDGKNGDRPDFRGGQQQPVELNRKKKVVDFDFDSSYVALHPFVRRPGPESDYHLPNPYEFWAETSELIQMLRKGHHGVKLDNEAWDRLITWIDLNVPDHGTWGEHRAIPGNGREMRALYRAKYANVTDDPESYPTPAPEPVAFVAPPAEEPRAAQAVAADGWPFDAAEALRRQTNGGPAELCLQVGTNQTLRFRRIPAGEFVMGDANGFADERPLTRVKIPKAFYMGECEIANAEFAMFKPDHNSGVLSTFNKDLTQPGEEMNKPSQPVARVTWQEAVAFCDWLSKQLGRKCRLPTEAEWEWACRAGTATPLNFGGTDANFAELANLADMHLTALCRRDSPKWLPCVPDVDDRNCASANIRSYKPNAWGLLNMHGNVAEWTRTTCAPYPYRDNEGPGGDKIVRGGSFYDRPVRARSAFRQAYPPNIRVFNVGFRVVIEEDHS